MTAHQLDTIHYGKREFMLSGATHPVPPEPKDFGIHKLNVNWQTNNHRGFNRALTVQDGQLLMTRMTLLGPCDDAKPIAGNKPRRRFRKNADTVYDRLKFQVMLTGKLLIVAEFVEMVMGRATLEGFYRPHMCRLVHELIFEDGQLIQEQDHSPQMDSLCQFLRQLPNEVADLDDKMPLIPNKSEGQAASDEWIETIKQHTITKQENLQARLRSWAVEVYGSDYDAWWLVYVP
jgi:hypothetical protein